MDRREAVGAGRRASRGDFKLHICASTVVESDWVVLS